MATKSKVAAAKSAAQSSSLEFNNSYSIKEFRGLCNNRPLEVVENPHTGKLFFTCGDVTGAVAKDIDYTGNCVVSEVSDGTQAFFMLHNKSMDNVRMVWND